VLSIAASLLLLIPASPAAVAAEGQSEWVRVVVDLSEQQVRVFDDAGLMVREWPASTGAASTPTPRGVFKVYSKSARTFVKSNPRVRMKWMTRFKGAVGFHGIPRRDGVPLWTPLGRRGVSHGCVRLADPHAKELFERLSVGATVIVRP
jgi:lipoprotein-anchoring transpeptidase ErfK/SrfK